MMQEKRSSLSVWEKKRQEDRKHIQTSPKSVICFQCGKGYSQHQGLLRHFRPAHLNAIFVMTIRSSSIRYTGRFTRRQSTACILDLHILQLAMAHGPASFSYLLSTRSCLVANLLFRYLRSNVVRNYYYWKYLSPLTRTTAVILNIYYNSC